jgi:hypothetical protein
MADENMYTWTIQSPDGKVHTFDAPDRQDAVMAALQKKRVETAQAEYSHLPLGQRSLKFADDMARLAAHAFSFGGIEHVPQLFGGASQKEEQDATEMARARHPMMQYPADIAGYGAQAAFLPSLVPKAVAAFGGGPVTRAVTGGIASGVEGAGLQGFQSAVEGNDIATGLKSGALAGPLGRLLVGTVGKTAEGISALDKRFFGGKVGEFGESVGEAASKTAQRGKTIIKSAIPIPNAMRFGDPRSAGTRFGEFLGKTMYGPKTPPTQAAAKIAEDTAAEAAGAGPVPPVVPVKPKGPLAVPIEDPAAGVAATAAVAPVVAPSAPPVPAGPLAQAIKEATPKVPATLVEARRKAFKAQEALAAAQRQLAGIKDPRGQANMRTKIKFLQGAHTSAKYKLSQAEAAHAAPPVPPKVAEDTALESAGAATPAEAPAVPAGPLAAESAAPVAGSVDEIAKAQARYDKADAALKIAQDKFKAEPNKLANRMRLENAAQEAAVSHRLNLAAKGITPGKATAKPQAPEDVVPRKATAGILSAGKNLPEPNQPGINTKTGKPISTAEPNFEAAKGPKQGSKQERAKAREQARAKTPAEQRADAIAGVQRAFSQAENRARTAQGHWDIDAALSKRMARVLENPDITNHLSKEEITALTKVKEGDPAVKVGRKLAMLMGWSTAAAQAAGGGAYLGGAIGGLPALGIMASIPSLSAIGHGMKREGARALMKSAKETLGISTPKSPVVDPKIKENLYRVLRNLGLR